MTEPIFLHMLGIPGAGKTTFLNILKDLWTDNSSPYLLGFDQVMQSMPEYQAIEDKIAAFEQYELPARKQGYKILGQLIDDKCSILFDNGGSAESHIDILKEAQSKGFRIIIVSISTPVDIAKRHVDSRSISEGRHTPMNYLEDRAEKIGKLRSSYLSLTPYFYEIENNGLDFTAFEKACYNLAREIIFQEKDQAA